LPIVALKQRDFDTVPDSGLRVTWLGHSTLIVEIDGHRVLLDPVFSERVSPVSFAGPRRFHPPPLPLAELPPLDAVIVSHNHYDHLDRAVIKHLRAIEVPVITALGVGGLLERWGIASQRVIELDWGEATTIGKLTVTATPARHFSGRGLFDADRTLWASWVMTGPEHRVFFTGDTGFFPDLVKIGNVHGPFDVTLIKIGAYGEAWPHIHLMPEDAVRVHQLLRGAVLLPIHWGTFNLAFHGWAEPPERLLTAARDAGVTVVFPRPGQQVEPSVPQPDELWWRDVR
jgi:L-ascorbate metabolism protein UlaG (beta-lactamase superfamily)